MKPWKRLKKPSILVIDAEDGGVVSRMSVAPFTRQGTVTMHPTLPLVAMSSYFEPFVEIRNWRTQEIVSELGPKELGGETANCEGLAWSPNGDSLLFYDSDYDGDSHGDYWFHFDRDTFALERNSSIRASYQVGGGLIARFNSSGDRIFTRGWQNRLEMVDGVSGNPIGESLPSSWTTDEKLPLRIDPMECFAGFVRSFDHPLDVGMMEVADGRECNVIVPQRPGSGMCCAFDPTGRILVATGDGLSIVDARRIRLVHRV